MIPEKDRMVAMLLKSNHGIEQYFTKNVMQEQISAAIATAAADPNKINILNSEL